MAIATSPIPAPSRNLGTLVNLLASHRATRAAQLDRWADIELAHGHHRAAERLARLADEQREPQAARP